MFSKKGMMLNKMNNQFTVAKPSVVKGKDSILRKTGRET
jgi:hypothetical protein